jgi:hypothetical protein
MVERGGGLAGTGDPTAFVRPMKTLQNHALRKPSTRTRTWDMVTNSNPLPKREGGERFVAGVASVFDYGLEKPIHLRCVP